MNKNTEIIKKNRLAMEKEHLKNGLYARFLCQKCKLEYERELKVFNGYWGWCKRCQDFTNFKKQI